MSKEVAITVTVLKEAERLANHIKNNLLSKIKIERLTFDQEDLDNSYQILDRLTYLNTQASVQSYIAQVTTRLEYAETALNQHMKTTMIMPCVDDQKTISLEGFHENRR